MQTNAQRLNSGRGISVAANDETISHDSKARSHQVSRVTVASHKAGRLAVRQCFGITTNRPTPSPAANDRNFKTDRGYTGHQMLDGNGLIHMNGRLYDPFIGRFLSPDPLIEEVGNLQSFNRYSTVAAGAASGGIQGGNVQSAVFGAFMATLSYGVGDWSGNHAATAKGVAMTGEEIAKQVAGHAVIGCVSGAASGGSCAKSGFAAAMSTAIGPRLLGSSDGLAQFVSSAIVGGVASRIAGGSFESGAVSGAFGYLFNDMAAEMHNGVDPASQRPEVLDKGKSWAEMDAVDRTFVVAVGAIGAAPLALEVGIAYGFFGRLGYSGMSSASSTGSTTMTVSRWGREGLQAGDWVMKGGAEGMQGSFNYLRSFKWQPGMSNLRAPFSSGKSYPNIPRTDVVWLKGWGIDGWIKGLYGQRKYIPK